MSWGRLTFEFGGDGALGNEVFKGISDRDNIEFLREQTTEIPHQRRAAYTESCSTGFVRLAIGMSRGSQGRVTYALMAFTYVLALGMSVGEDGELHYEAWRFN